MAARRLISGLIALAPACIAPAARAAPPPPAVLVAPAQVQNVAPQHSYIGHVQAIQSVQIVPRVTAFIETEPAPQGSDVKAGDVLFGLQKAQFEAAVQSAQAQLASAQAALRNAQLVYERASQLNNQGFAATSDLDAATATRDQDQANVMAAQANLALAQLNLSYCTITAPISGRIGVFTLTPGNLVTPSTPALTTVNQMNPIRVVFSVSDRDLANAQQRTGSNLAAITDRLAVHLALPNGAPYDQAGRISFLNNQVDPRTGTISIYADFPNPEALLVPGAYVTVNVSRAEPEERPLVPVAAVQTDQSGSYVLTVGADNKVAQQPITLGRQIAQDYIVTKGLAGGERVIVEGVQKVRPGEVVNPQPIQAQPPTANQG